MFQASRNWSNISSIVNVMIDHLGRLPHLGRDLSRNGIKLVDERGELIENYDIIFKELFCAAARALAEKTKSNLTQVGILWDEILPTGTGGDIRRQQQQQQPSSRRSHPSNGSDDGMSLEKAEFQQPKVQELYRGSLMFLVRRVESSREVTDLEAAGYRFADLHQVSPIIASSMQIKTDNLEARLANMASYAQQDSSRLSPGVHLGFFAVRARVGSQGFDVLVRRTARHLLPSAEMPVDHLEPWQLNFLRQLDGFSPARVVKAIENRKNLSAQDFFASQLLTCLKQLRDEIEDDIFEESTLTAKVVQIPCRPGTASSSTQTAHLIAFKVVIPIHYPVRCSRLEFVPLSLFKVQQLAYKDSPHNLIFSRSVHREISPILNTIPIVVHSKPASNPRRSGGLTLAPTRMQRLGAWFRRRGRPSGSLPRTTVDADGNPIPTVYGHGRAESNHSSSTLKLWNPAASSGHQNNSGNNNRDALRPGERSNSWQDQGSDDIGNTPKGSSTFDAVERYHSGPTSPGSTASDLTRAPQPVPHASPSPAGGGGAAVFGGILVSQEITVNVVDAGGAPGGGPDVARRMTTHVGTGNNNNRRPSGAAGQEKIGGGEVAIEMQPLGNKAGVTVQAESVGEATTFVDELFAACVEWR